MGVGKFFKGLGKVALKAAPIAAAFIPGVGPIASTLIGAAAGGADRAINGGGVKSALLGGLMGGAEGYGANALQGAVGGMGKTNQMIPGVGDGGPASSSLIGGFGNYLKKNPMVPLAALSILGGLGDKGSSGGGQAQHRAGYVGKYTNPEETLARSNMALSRFGQGMFENEQQNPSKVSHLLGEAPKPVTIPGLPFQIGGGLGHNPAMDDLTVDNSWMQKYDPFQSMAQGDFAAEQKKQQGRV